MIDLHEIAEELDQDYLDISYVESEGDNCLRIDYGTDNSLWLYSDGQITQGGYLNRRIKDFLIIKGFKI